ncbi:MAG: succinate dehydrogenase/fumarate reductase flavoprotein subunit [Firmicutes bacterium]|nr:succinate dehydrogenase/fumarate reductase flavoprotein subunit [Bacillota bacterium]
MQVKIRKEIIKTELLIIGGGIAGLQAAITAGQEGTSVIVAEKADTRRSGSGANGNDHYMCYIPECHGDDFKRVISEINEGMEGGPWQDQIMLRKMMKRSYGIIQKWESYGIDMRPTGKWVFEGHAMPGRQRYHLKYDGQNQKAVLTQKALENGAQIMNKVFINEVLVNEEGRAVGAIGFSLAEDDSEVIIFQAKAVLLATAQAMRMYPHGNPTFIFNTHSCPAAAGGAAIGYRAGARLVNLDVPYIHAGVKGFARSGKATWIGVLSDIHGKPVGPFLTKPNRETGDAMMDIWPGIFGERLDNGTGPTYMNCTELSEEDLKYQEKAFESEGIDSITEYCEQRGIDLRKSMIEFGTYDYSLAQRGIDINLDGMTTVQGLYAAGICCGNVRGNITNASVWGDVVGEHSSEYVKQVEEFDISEHPLIKEKIDFYMELMTKKIGAHWLEVNSTLQRIMNDYVGLKVRSETLLTAGIKYLADLKRYSVSELKCENSHELMRTLEVLDLIDLAEAVALTAKNRQETRGNHKRVDFTYTNPLLNDKFQTIEKTKDGIKMAFRDKEK